MNTISRCRGTLDEKAPWCNDHVSEQERNQELTYFAGLAEILEAHCTALDRRREVLDLIEVAADRDDAVEMLQDKLGLTHLGALTVLDLQLHRLTVNERKKIAAELVRVRDRMRELQ